MNRYGWHWRHTPGMLSNNDNRSPEVGERLEAKTRMGRPVKRPVRCGPGMHAHPEINGTTHFGDRLSFVLVENVLPAKPGLKFVGTHRTILWEAVVPPKVKDGSAKQLLAWAARKGFKRASATAKARRLRARAK